MGDFLSQEEVNALLSAVAQGEVRAEERQDESEPKADVMMYDFKRPNRVSRDQLRVLQTLHENFAREFAGTASAHLRSVVEIDVISVEQLTYLEYVMSLSNPTNLYVFSMAPLEGSGVLEVNPSLVLGMIERLFGGPGVISMVKRNVTSIEQRVMLKIIDRAFKNLSEAWRRLMALEFALRESQSNPQYVQLVPPSETIIVVSLEMKLQHGSGLMSLCYPYVFLEPVVAKLSGQGMVAFKVRKSTEETTRLIEAGLVETPLTVVARLGDGSISVRDFLALQKGDVITLDTRIGTPSLLEIGGRSKFLGTPGACGKRRAVQVIAELEGGARTNGKEKSGERP